MFLKPQRIELPEGRAVIALEVYEEAGRMICGIRKLKGRIDLPPRAWTRVVRRELARIETMARDAGAVEMRLCGRDWSRVLPDYEPLDGLPNGLRKVLG